MNIGGKSGGQKTEIGEGPPARNWGRISGQKLGETCCWNCSIPKIGKVFWLHIMERSASKNFIKTLPRTTIGVPRYNQRSPRLCKPQPTTLAKKRKSISPISKLGEYWLYGPAGMRSIFKDFQIYLSISECI